MMSGVGADRMAAGIDATRKAGMDPGALFGSFMASPSLAAKLRDPRVLTALVRGRVFHRGWELALRQPRSPRPSTLTTPQPTTVRRPTSRPRNPTTLNRWTW